jgi:hypothetical protein
MSTHLLLTNLPCNCSDLELKEWIESRGFQTGAIRIVSDFVSGASPAFGYVELKTDVTTSEAIAALNGKILGRQNVWVTAAPARFIAENPTT